MNKNGPVVINVRDSLPQPGWRTEQVRQLELKLIAKRHISLYQLMVEAGEAVFYTIQSLFPACKHIWVLCGKGNNGGDGYVVARLAKLAGLQVTLAAFGEPAADIPADQARSEWLAAGGNCVSLHDLTGEPDLIVDALLGIGPSTPLRGDLLTWIQFVNRHHAKVLSVDIPSGLCADTGMPLGCAIKADVTVTVIGLKTGLMTGLAADYTGKLLLARLESELLGHSSGAIDIFSYDAVTSLLPPRARTTHKGQCGKILLVGGNKGMPGAIKLASEATLRTGAGLVKVFCHESNQMMVFVGRPELMLAQDLKHTLAWSDVIVIGPGLGQDDWSRNAFHEVLQTDKKIVLDADGLSLLAESPSKRANWILTPHPGEAARLLQCQISDIQHDRFAAVQELQHRFGGVILLKGSGTLVCDGKRLVICTEGNPGMASGGMGDVLSGIIASLLGQGLNLYDAAFSGALIHGRAANIHADKCGERGMLASDLINCLQTLVNPQRYIDE